ncbi:Involved in the biosynthesis of the osmoprotectant glycine betaine. Catalyzes the reversible oxidation of betaine aldehyde to the corresponding acid [Vibrio sp. B1ASS3]|nr:Involved in the biosynthesis of the osmoprotectant glycine betaine. Catalyzes the reversible oxidation of betaine aldehyde to the corresponding acid [Vibrio sp. B1ASS3]CAE6885125.1 Involved in the biosynthesis of the osmoprotectant glycine betaine. Catalyzes the reversible oxidation of betaine aldehyde to the corresponding acid [Vibrio sp. B1ASS3]
MMQQIKSETLRVLFESLSSQDGIAVINPATEQELIRLKPSSLDELDAQIEACKSAQVEWAKLSAKARSASLKKWFQLLVEHTEDIANIIT